MASPGTRIWTRMRKDGRLLKTEKNGRFFGNAGTTNIIPKKMTHVELQAGFLELRERVYAWEDEQLQRIWDAIDHELTVCKESFRDPEAREFRL